MQYLGNQCVSTKQTTKNIRNRIHSFHPLNNSVIRSKISVWLVYVWSLLYELSMYVIKRINARICGDSETISAICSTNTTAHLPLRLYVKCIILPHMYTYVYIYRLSIKLLSELPILFCFVQRQVSPLRNSSEFINFRDVTLLYVVHNLANIFTIHLPYTVR